MNALHCVVFIFEQPHTANNRHRAFKNIQTKTRERETKPLPLEFKWVIVASPSKENRLRAFIVKKGPPPPNELLQLRRGARQYRARGRGEYFDTMGFFVA
jgi:hypothetical protein